MSTPTFIVSLLTSFSNWPLSTFSLSGASLFISTAHFWLEPLIFYWNLSLLIGTAHFSLELLTVDWILLTSDLNLSFFIGTTHCWLEPLTFDWNFSFFIGIAHFSLPSCLNFLSFNLPPLSLYSCFFRSQYFPPPFHLHPSHLSHRLCILEISWSTCIWFTEARMVGWKTTWAGSQI